MEGVPYTSAFGAYTVVRAVILVDVASTLDTLIHPMRAVSLFVDRNREGLSTTIALGI